MPSSPLIPPFQEALGNYRDGYMAARNLAARSRVEYATGAAQFLAFLQEQGIRDLKRVGPNHIQAYLASLDRRGLAGVTRRKKLIILRTFFGWLKASGASLQFPSSRPSGPAPRGRGWPDTSTIGR